MFTLLNFRTLVIMIMIVMMIMIIILRMATTKSAAAASTTKLFSSKFRLQISMDVIVVKTVLYALFPSDFVFYILSLT